MNELVIADHIFIEASDTIKRAVVDGIEVVERLPTRSQRLVKQDAPPPFHGRCHCGLPGLYVGAGGWFCEDHRDGIYSDRDAQGRIAS